MRLNRLDGFDPTFLLSGGKKNLTTIYNSSLNRKREEHLFTVTRCDLVFSFFYGAKE